MTNHPVALITGGARRIGAEIARRLHAQNYNLVIHYRHSDQDAKALVDELNQARPNSALALQADCLILSEIQTLARQAASYWGRLDVLINNASSFYPTVVSNASEADWDDLFGSNVKGAYFLAQALQADLQKQGGSIINITDVHASRPMGEHSLYCMAKAALLMMTRSLAKEFAPHVRVNAVAPGAIAWPEGDSALSDELKDKILSKTALKRHGAPSDIAQTVEFLILRADYITGAEIKVDGGRHLN